MTYQLITVYSLTLLSCILRIFYLRKYFNYKIYDAIERSLVDSLIFGVIISIITFLLIPYTKF